MANSEYLVVLKGLTIRATIEFAWFRKRIAYVLHYTVLAIHKSTIT